MEVSIKRLNWIDELLDRAKKSNTDGKPHMVGTRIGVAQRIVRELIDRAKKYSKRDKAVRDGKEPCPICGAKK